MTKPRKAACLIVTRPIRSVEQNEYYDYQVLLLKRCESLPFGGTYSFPGGRFRRRDFDFIKQRTSEFALQINENHDLQYHLFKIAALRKAFEDTGLLFLSKDDNSESILKILQQLKKNTNDPKLNFKDISDALPLAYD